MKSGRLIGSILYLTLCVALVIISYLLDRSQFYILISTYSVSFILYLAISFKYYKHFTVAQWLAGAIFIRLILLFATPNLSDDYHRFLWDGELLHQEINPLAFTPNQIMNAEFIATTGGSNEWYNKMNSREYYTIYPPVLQTSFYLSSIGDQTTSKLWILKALTLIAEVITIYYLLKLFKLKNLSRKWTLLYLFNPLVILEFSANLHTEVYMILFLVMFLYYFNRDQSKSALAYGLTVLSKIIPLMLLPAILFKLKGTEAIKFLVISVTIIIAITFPFFVNPINFLHFLDSFTLYFKSFEFNAGVYNILRWIGFKITGYNQIAVIGLVLPFITLIVTLLIAYYRRKKDLTKTILFTFTVYLLLSSIVHPWYVIILIPLGLITGYVYPLVWSFVIFLSYSAYQTEAYAENYLLIAIEYILLYAVLFWEVIYTKEGLFTRSLENDKHGVNKNLYI